MSVTKTINFTETNYRVKTVNYEFYARDFECPEDVKFSFRVLSVIVDAIDNKPNRMYIITDSNIHWIPLDDNGRVPQSVMDKYVDVMHVDNYQEDSIVIGFKDDEGDVFVKFNITAEISFDTNVDAQ